jgi:hypothetical protein
VFGRKGKKLCGEWAMQNKVHFNKEGERGVFRDFNVVENAKRSLSLKNTDMIKAL